MSLTPLPFNRPHVTGSEFAYIEEAIANGHLSGNGPFTRRCNAWLEDAVGASAAMLTHSCTGALEMCAILADLGPGDEVIMPSFTFVSTANAVVLRGAAPVFVDVRPDTLNLDERVVEAAITPRTKAILVVHYAGVACEMDAIMEIAGRHSLLVVEDAAHALGASYRGRPLGGLGQLAALSFHETKNVMCGEGGALLCNDERFTDRARVILDKGTNRDRFFRGEVARYTWTDIGSSYLPSEINAAFLWAQLEHAGQITSRRLELWERYHDAFAALEDDGLLRRPVVPDHCSHNAHMYHVLLADPAWRPGLIEGLERRGVNAVFHYVPLHSSPAGERFGRAHGDMTVTDDASARLVRLPLWVGMDLAAPARIARAVAETLREVGAP